MFPTHTGPSFVPMPILMVFIMITGYTSEKKKKSANYKGQDWLLREPGKCTTRPRATEQDLEVTVRDRERQRAWAWDSAFIRV